MLIVFQYFSTISQYDCCNPRNRFEIFRRCARYKQKMLKTGYLYTAFRENSPLKRPEWHVLTSHHTVLPATHLFYPPME